MITSRVVLILGTAISMFGVFVRDSARAYFRPIAPHLKTTFHPSRQMVSSAVPVADPHLPFEQEIYPETGRLPALQPACVVSVDYESKNQGRRETQMTVHRMFAKKTGVVMVPRRASAPLPKDGCPTADDLANDTYWYEDTQRNQSVTLSVGGEEHAKDHLIIPTRCFEAGTVLEVWAEAAFAEPPLFGHAPIGCVSEDRALGACYSGDCRDYRRDCEETRDDYRLQKLIRTTQHDSIRIRTDTCEVVKDPPGVPAEKTK